MAKRLTKAQAVHEYTKWHWGKAPVQIVRWNDPVYPQTYMPECGRLVELRVKQPGKRAATRIVLTKAEANGSHLVFNPRHKFQRLYIYSHPKFREKMRKKYGMRENYAPSHKLATIAKAVGGHHATSDYPNLTGQWIGELTHVIYATDKEGDGFSFYIHKMGEEGGKRPHVVVDGQGRCWIVGGDYTVEEGGITN